MKLSRIVGIMLLVIITTLTVKAQDPGDPCPDPDLPCEVPLDTWVIFFAIMAVAVAAIYLYRRQQAVLK